MVHPEFHLAYPVRIGAFTGYYYVCFTVRTPTNLSVQMMTLNTRTFIRRRNKFLHTLLLKGHSCLLYQVYGKAVSWFRQLVAGLPPRRPGFEPIPVAARSKAWVYGRSLAGIVGSNPAGGMDVCVVFVVQGLVWIISDMKKDGRV